MLNATWLFGDQPDNVRYAGSEFRALWDTHLLALLRGLISPYAVANLLMSFNESAGLDQLALRRLQQSPELLDSSLTSAWHDNRLMAVGVPLRLVVSDMSRVPFGGLFEHADASTAVLDVEQAFVLSQDKDEVKASPKLRAQVVVFASVLVLGTAESDLVDLVAAEVKPERGVLLVDDRSSSFDDRFDWAATVGNSEVVVGLDAGGITVFTNDGNTKKVPLEDLKQAVQQPGLY